MVPQYSRLCIEGIAIWENGTLITKATSTMNFGFAFAHFWDFWDHVQIVGVLLQSYRDETCSFIYIYWQWFELHLNSLELPPSTAVEYLWTSRLLSVVSHLRYMFFSFFVSKTRSSSHLIADRSNRRWFCYLGSCWTQYLVLSCSCSHYLSENCLLWTLLNISSG